MDTAAGFVLRLGKTMGVVSLLLSVTFACGLLIAVAHVLNRRFVAPVYDVLANLTAFGCAVGASSLLGHTIPATLSGVAILCWLILARRTILDRRLRVRAGVGRAHGAPESVAHEMRDQARPPAR